MPNFRPWFWREVRLFELRILKTIARHYSIQKWLFSKESWVKGGCDVIQSRHLNKRGYLSMQKRSAMVMFILRRVLFVYARLGKDYAVMLLRCLIGWRHILPRPNSPFWTRPFLNWVMAGNGFENSLFKKSDFSSKSWLKIKHGRYL